MMESRFRHYSLTACSVSIEICRLRILNLDYPAMSTIAEIIDAVKQLSETDKSEFLARLREIDFDDAWDRQMEVDVKAGRLDFMLKELDEDIAAGRVRPIDEICRER